MPTEITALHRAPDTGGVPAVTADGGWVEGAWAWATDLLGNVPPWIWVALVTATFAGTLATIPGLRRQARKAGERVNAKTPLSDEARKDRKLLIGALVPATLFWAAVLIGSGRGLVAFGRDDLNWTGGWEYLIPLTLDGVAISFGLLAFRSVHKNQNPDRATHIAWGAMVASAALNFFHEFGGSSLGAAYLAILSLFGMLIFHEFLAQFEEGADYVKRDKPKFGLRWITWPSNTACAWVAWRNHTPDIDDDTRVTVRMAVANLETVRAGKAQQRAAKVDQPSLLERINPFLRSRQLETALTGLRAVNAAEAAQRAADINALTAQLDDALGALAESRRDLAAARSELNTTTEDLNAAQGQLNDLTVTAASVDASTATQIRNAELKVEAAEAEVERLNTVHNEELRVAEERHNERYNEGLRNAEDTFNAKLAQVRAEAETVSLNAYRNAGKKKPTVEPSTRAVNKPSMSDEEAVQAMFNAQRDPSFAWSQNAVRQLTGAGWARIPKLIEAWLNTATQASNGDAEATG